MHKVKTINFYYNQAIVGDLTDEQTVSFNQFLLKKKSFFQFEFIIECAILLMFPLPFYEKFILVYFDTAEKENQVIVYFLGDWLLVGMFARVFFIYRSIINYSIYTDAFSKKVCKSYGFTSGVRFSYKVQLLNNPGYFVSLLFSCFVFFFAYILRIFEIPYYRHSIDHHDTKNVFDHYFNSVWLLVMTITTVGYGDYTPNTSPGKCIAMFAALWGAFMISLLVVSAASLFELNNQ